MSATKSPPAPDLAELARLVGAMTLGAWNVDAFSPENAAGIVALRNAAPWLLARARRAAELEAALGEALAEWQAGLKTIDDILVAASQCKGRDDDLAVLISSDELESERLMLAADQLCIGRIRAVLEEER